MASNSDNSTINSNSTGDGGPFYYGQNSASFNPTTAVVIISLIGGCFVLALVSVFLRKYIRGDAALTVAQSNTTQSGSYNVTSKGLLKEDVDALPLVHREDLDEKDTPRECPVCLADFEAEDSLRLLPTCKHVFHQDCIDAWFDAHSTCPLCRASLVGHPVGEAKLLNSGGEHVAEAGGHGEPAETITEVSESGDSDIESRQLSSGDAPLGDSRTVPLNSREDSARESLFRNSESLKRVTTGSDQEPINKNSSFRKPPASPSVRRSSSLSADLIALRNLLMRQSDQNGDAPSRRWFSRARSLNLAQRDRTEGDEWVTIDLESGKAVSNADAPVASSSSSSSAGESSKGPPGRAWSGRWSLASWKGAVISPLTRSRSDVSSRSGHQPI